MKRVFINGGHGGDDPGCSGYGLVEKELTHFLISLIGEEILSMTSAVEVMGYQSQEVWSIAKRKIIYEANLFSPDLFVSVHVNSGGGTGFESFIHSNADDKTIAMRNLFHNEVKAWLLSQGIKMHDGGTPGGEMKAEDFYVLGWAKCPAILTENLFIDNPSEAALLKDEAFLRGLAKAHARGCLAALGIEAEKRSVLPHDVYPGYWAEKAIKWAIEAGIMKGHPDGTFRPEAGLTRAEEAVLLYKTHGPGAKGGS